MLPKSTLPVYYILLTIYALNRQRLAFSKITELGDEERIEREALGGSIRKIKNYGVVRMPNLMPFY
jgi:hypothetical protein